MLRDCIISLFPDPCDSCSFIGGLHEYDCPRNTMSGFRYTQEFHYFDWIKKEERLTK